MASGLAQLVLRPTAFMEHHAHNFNGKALLEKGKAQLIGSGTKKRNFVAATDVAGFALRALLDDPPPFRAIEIGGPGNYSNTEVAERYARAAGIELRIGRLPVAVARVLSVLAKPLHPGMARMMRIFALPDDAFDETFDGSAALEREHGVRLTTLDEFIAARVAEAKGATAAG